MPKKEKVRGRDDQASLSTNISNFNQSRNKEKNSVPIEDQDNWNDESNVNHASYLRTAWKDRIDDREVPTQNVGNDESFETNAHVGAFAVAGIPGRIHYADEQSFQDSTLSMTHASQDTTSVTITSARVVEDVIVNAIPLEDSLFDNEVSSNVNALSKKGSILKYSLIAVTSLLLLTGIIIPAVIFTRKSPKDSSKTAAKDFLEKLKPLLTNISRQELEVPNSVPYLALDWLLNNSNFSEYSFDRQVQRFVMASFYHSTVGRSWIVNQGWLTDEDECTWYQSSNESLCVNGTLRVLSLMNNSLIGLLPNDIALFSSLTYLNLRENELQGTILSSIGTLQALTWLDLAGNKFTGTIPSSIKFLTSLITFDLQANLLKGSIPLSIEAMRNVTALSLSYNFLNGSIPTSIGGLLHLSYLGLEGNNLNGTIPLSLGALTELKFLSLRFNQLIGTIPSSLGTLTELSILLLTYNQLTGTIPSSIGSLTKLGVLDMSENELNGAIPSSLGSLKELMYLSLWSNQLTGTVPSTMGLLTKLTDLWLSSNQLKGKIPSSFGSLQFLREIHFSRAQLSGTIPSVLGTLKRLSYLSLYSNQLSGTIPSSMGLLTNMTTLNLHNNQLKGSIPVSLCTAQLKPSVDCNEILCDCCVGSYDEDC